ncbi:MAG: S-layer homology domain-containing protein [Armatimonadetes bacterium]|nr:S-layer homology domain-containing protein [Armatimonadota bacterium]
MSSFILFFLLLPPLNLSLFLPGAFPALTQAGAPAQGRCFDDLENHWAKSTVYRLAALDLFVGYPDGTFRPEQPVTQLEAVTLVMRAGGFAEARTARNYPGSGSSSGTRPGQEQIPAVPWGEEYLRLAVEKEFLPPPLLASFAPNAAITRAEMAAFLSRALQLPVVPDAKSSTGIGTRTEAEADTSTGATTTGENVTAGGNAAASGNGFLFTDLEQAPPFYAPYIQAAARAGVMSGYPDGSFRPNQGLRRGETAGILSRLLDENWVKVPPDRRLTGWISGIKQAHGGSQEIEFTTLEGVRKIRPAPGLKCFSRGQESELFRAVNHRVEMILDNKKQACYINIFERRNIQPPSEKLTGTVKSVILGEDNLLQIVDLDCADRTLPLAWSAVVEGKSNRQGFLSLRPGTFVEAALTGGEVTKVTILDVKKISGTVESITGKTLRLARRGDKMKWPEWFHYWDRARIVDKDGKKAGGIEEGDRVQITYLDPLPDEIEDERVLEITVTKR